MSTRHCVTRSLCIDLSGFYGILTFLSFSSLGKRKGEKIGKQNNENFLENWKTKQ
jgi:hypothetical protein